MVRDSLLPLLRVLFQLPDELLSPHELLVRPEELDPLEVVPGSCVTRRHVRL